MTLNGLDIPLARISDLCRELEVEELAVFGSALREDFSPCSDVDFLVKFKNDDYGPWLSKLNRLEAGLAQILGRPTDVVPRDDLKWVIRERVLESAEMIYRSVDSENQTTGHTGITGN